MKYEDAVHERPSLFSCYIFYRSADIGMESGRNSMTLPTDSSIGLPTYYFINNLLFLGLVLQQF